MVQNPPAHVGDAGPIAGSGRSPGEENGNPLQYSCPRNPTDKVVWWATVHGIKDGQDLATKHMQTHKYILVSKPLAF